jgi:hypothetical protein
MRRSALLKKDFGVQRPMSSRGRRASRCHLTGLKVLKRHARRARAALGHQRVQYAEVVRVEPTKALRVPVIHPESGKVPQRVQVSIPIVSLQRILRMLESEVIKAGWVNAVAARAPAAQEGAPKPVRFPKISSCFGASRAIDAG